MSSDLKTQTFGGAIKLLGDSHERLTIGNNTTIEAEQLDDEQVVLVRLHGHGIIRLHGNGDVSVRDCGYVTAVTYTRINAFLPPGWVAQRRGGMGYAARRQGSDSLGIASDLWTRIPG